MSWTPKYIIMGGMYGGSRCPAGDLQILVNKMENHVTNNVSVRMEGEAYSLEQDYWKWGRAYGLNFSVLRTYIENHMDNTPHEFELCELEINNPQGAQFYKQSLVFWCSITAAEMTEGAGETDPLKYCYSTISITRVCRREYPTPYSAYVDTDLGVLQGGKIANIYRSGIKSYGGFWTRLLLDCYLPLGTFTYDNKNYFGFAIYMEDERADGYDYGTSFMMLGIDFAVLTTAFGGEFEPEEQTDPNEEEEPEEGPGKGGSGGGEGDHILPDEPVLVPPLPVLGSSSVSWLTTYMMTLADINEFGEELVEPSPMQMLKSYFVDPLDAVVNITLCPAIPDGPRYQKTPIIHASPTDYEWSRSFTAISGQYGIVNCGFIDIPPYWDSAFDFDPFTQIHIFLPFIGYRALNADEVMGARIGVIYHVDVVTGDCTAVVTVTAPSESIYGPMPEKVIGQYNGNCGISVPIGRVSHDAFVGSMMNLMTVGASVAIGGVVGGEMAAGNVGEAQLASQLTSSGMNACSGSKSKIERSGALGGNCGYMGVRKPYIIRSIARQNLPDNYKELNGYPCNKGGTLGQYSGTGLAVVESIQLNNIPAMEEERKEILEWLKGGVLI